MNVFSEIKHLKGVQYDTGLEELYLTAFHHSLFIIFLGPPPITDFLNY